MYRIINANGVDFRNPEGTFSLTKADKFNVYEGEDGHKTVESVRSDVISASVSYKGLTVDEVTEMCEALTTVTTFLIFDATTNTQRTITASVESIKVDKVYHKNDLSVWSLSFKIEEL